MKWTTLRHQGVAFPPEYEYRGLVVRIKGEPVKLEPLQEEMLMAWAKKKDTPYVLLETFQKNFCADLCKVLPERFADIQIGDIDWTELHAIVERAKTANLSPEEKKRRSQERKALREELKARFGTATIDEMETEIGAYLVEPPGILMGRGEHPLQGKWKPRILPETVILNLDEEAPVPPAPAGHSWGKIVHEHGSMWVASWYDELAKKRKYVWLADSSHLRQERDKEKYVKAAKLENGLERVRAEIRKRMDYRDSRTHAALDREEKRIQSEIRNLEARLLKQQAESSRQQAAGNSGLEDQLDGLRNELEQIQKQRDKVRAAEMKIRQIATVCYLIDRLAMRVGDEKDEDEADTVGASTLRVEHVQIGKDRIEFDFLGKDSVQWQKFLPLNGGEQVLARNLQAFMRGKAKGDQVFDRIGSTHVNRFLSSIVPGLTAKVFRTFHATTTVRTCLRQNAQVQRDDPTFEKEYVAKLANLQAAITCNHKRTPPKNWEESLAKKEEAVVKIRAAKPDVEKLRAEIGTREKALAKLLEEQRKLRAHTPRLVKAKEEALAKLQAKPVPESEKDAAKVEKQRRAAEKALAKTKRDLKKKAARMEERIAKARTALEQARVAPERADQDHAERVAKAERVLQLAKATRDYNLGTSLKNYIDPRVYKAWGDHVDYHWKRLYTKALQRKFTWVDQSRVKWNGTGIEDIVGEENSASPDEPIIEVEVLQPDA